MEGEVGCLVAVADPTNLGASPIYIPGLLQEEGEGDVGCLIVVLIRPAIWKAKGICPGMRTR